MSLKTYNNTTRWAIIATDHTGQRGFFTSYMWWKGDKRVAENINFAMLFHSKEQAQQVVNRWINTQVHGIEYVPVTLSIKLKKGGKRNG